MIQRTGTLAGAVLMWGLMIITGCRGDKDKTAVSDLPDLNAQMQSYRVIEDTKVRTGPGEQFRPVGDIKRNSRVQVVGKDGDWLLIVSKKGNAPGYIAIESAQPADNKDGEAEPGTPTAEGMYEALVNTRVRSGPGFHHSVVAEVKKGMKMHVVSEENGWLRIESKRGNPPGYIESALARPVPEGVKSK